MQTTFTVRFTMGGGMEKKETVPATTDSEAKRIIEARYPGARVLGTTRNAG